MRRVFLISVAVVLGLDLPQGSATANPATGPKIVREIRREGYRVRLDLAGQVLSVRVPEDREWGDREGSAEATPRATLSGLGADGFASAAVLAQKAKQFDDGLYAAVELAAQNGAGRFGGKARLLHQLARRLARDHADATQPVAAVLAGAKLGLPDFRLPPDCQPAVQALLDAFEADDLRSKPIGFYAWSSPLKAVFRQDRMLQAELVDRAGTTALVQGLHADPKGRAIYESYLNLVSQLTNPPAYADLRRPLQALDRGQLDGGRLDVPAKGIYFFPPSKSHETELVKQLYGNRPIPDDFNLADELIRRIRSGKLKLAPGKASGWYDYQTWALEPLVIPEQMPEAPRLRFDPTYTGQLLKLMKGILTLTRETHIKQVESPLAGSELAPREPRVIINVSPELSAEPLASYYFRRACGYGFVRGVLDGAFGPAGLQGLHRLTAAGPVAPDLDHELRAIEELFYGAHATVCRQIGIEPQTSTLLPVAGSTAQAAFAAWTKRIDEDADVGQDARTMVPVFYDLQRRKTKVWVMLGWVSREVQVDFAQTPPVEVLDAAGKAVTDDRVKVNFYSASYRAAYPVMAEVYVSKVLERDEFRRHCDRYQTCSAILANLP